MTSARRVALVNPNTDAETTLAMIAAAQRKAGATFIVEGLTATVGPKMITNPEELLVASSAVMEMADRLSSYDGVIIGGFGDPGVRQLQELLSIPVLGIGETSIRHAASRGRRFAVATTTPDLASSIGRQVAALELGHAFAGVFLTGTGPLELREDAQRLLTELGQAVRAAIAANAEAVVIGGGPFAAAAVALHDAYSAQIVQPIPVATSLMQSRIAASDIMERS
jgi:allantoin racemase